MISIRFSTFLLCMAALASLQAAEEVINGIAAVVNGVIAPVLLVFVMVVAHDRRVMGERVPGPLLLGLGWLTVAIMGAAAVALFALR